MLYFVFVGVCSFILSLADRTPLHNALYAILPRFEGLHAHSPERVVIVFIHAIALLAAATVSFLPQWDRSSALLVAIALAPAVLTLALSVSSVASGLLLSREVTVLIGASCVLVACIALTKRAPIQLVALIGLVFLTLWDPAGRIAFRGFAEKPQLEQSLQDSLAEASGSFLYANGAASFLAQQSATQPGRYAGFDPALLPDPKTIGTLSPQLGYRSARGLKNVGMYWLLVHNWGTWFGVEDIQGYNPLQSQRYVAYIDALNGHRQEYHERDLFPAGLRSPLLDLLNLRYLIVPADAPDRVDLAPLLADFPPVYADAHVRILENPEALPRAWLVHQARQVAPGEALGLLADGAVDPRQTALLETAPPTLSAPTDPAAETVRLIQNAPDRLELDVRADSPALLVLSEVWDPGWSARVDGEAAPVDQADYLLRAVPIPPGQHTVVLSYDPPLLRVGLVFTLVTVLAIIVVWVRLAFRERERPRPAFGHAP
jgi:hypothetical protein